MMVNNIFENFKMIYQKFSLHDLNFHSLLVITFMDQLIRILFMKLFF